MADASQPILQYGAIGISLLMSWYALWRVFDLYTKSMESRLVDSRQMQEAINNNTRATEDHTRSVEALTSLLKATRP